MKKVVFESSETVSINEITNQSIVGIVWNSGLKTVIMPCLNAHSEIVGYYASGLVGEEVDGKIVEPSIKSYLRMCEYHDVYVFDTTKELYKWLSE